MPEIDLFDDLQIEEKEKIVIKEEKKYDGINTTTEENKLHGDIRNKNCNDGLINKSGRKTNTGNKQPKTSNLGYKIGLVLDILAIAIFIYLAITISLYFLITLAITVPIGIFCVIKLC